MTVANERPAAPPDPVLSAGGDGLVGLAERVRLVGGEVVTRPTVSGGFEVIARMSVAGQA